VIQDKTKTRFGRWIHDLLAHDINSVHFGKKNVVTYL